MMSDEFLILKHASAHRYAVYFAPTVESDWWRAGSRWLGRDALSEERCEQPVVPGLLASEQWQFTNAPRRYGWHATLKAPFSLKTECNLFDLRIAMRHMVQTLRPFSIPKLRVTLLDDFLALTPDVPDDRINHVARTCVTALHPFAAALGEAELERRRAAKLTPAEDALLLQWGYPYVFDQFRFHLSLTGSLTNVSDATINLLHEAASQWFGSLPPCQFDSVALFAEPAPGADFVLLEHVPLSA